MFLIFSMKLVIYNILSVQTYEVKSVVLKLANFLRTLRANENFVKVAHVDTSNTLIELKEKLGLIVTFLTISMVLSWSYNQGQTYLILINNSSSAPGLNLPVFNIIVHSHKYTSCHCCILYSSHICVCSQLNFFVRI